MAPPLRLGVVGTLVWDTIVRDDRPTSVEEWGGIGYALEAFSVALPEEWEVCPLVKVGKDLSESALRYIQLGVSHPSAISFALSAPYDRTRNPFADVRIKPKPPKGIWKYVPYKDAVATIEACTSQYTSRIGWQVFIALQRFAGLRRGEALALEVQDVDLTTDPMLIKVYASKTAR